jgi:hypothetical protein
VPRAREDDDPYRGTHNAIGKYDEIALLHEMVHVKLHLANKDGAAEDHGAAFRSEIKRLMEAGAYDSLL